MPDTPEPPQPAASAHVLLVDDDEPLRAAFARVLRLAGFRVSMAGDFRVALALLEGADRIDLLLTDIVMPGSVNGVALGRMAMMRQRGIRLIYLTAYDIPGLDREADGPVLRKPVADSALVAEVRRVLAQG